MSFDFLPARLAPVGATFLALLQCGPGLAAESPRIPFVRLSLEQGLSQGTVNCILQDRAGFLWLGTQDGLNRYNGYDLTVYKNDPGRTSSLPADWIADLAEDPSGDLWVATEGGGLARWYRSSDTFIRYRHSPAASGSLPSDHLRVLHTDRAGALWIGTFQTGLARLAAGARDFEHFRHQPGDPSSLSDDRVRSIHEDREGHLWVGTLGGLNRVVEAEPGRVAFARIRHDADDRSSLSDDRVFAILEDSSGTLWVGTENGLNRRRRADGGFERFHHDPADPASLADDWITGLLEDRSGRLWIATDGGLSMLDPKRRPASPGEAPAFFRYRHDALDLLSLSNDRLLALYEDRGGVLWAGTQGGGVNKWSPLTMSFAHYRSAGSEGTGLANDAVFAFSEDRDGRVFVGSLGGLDIFDRSTGRFTRVGHGSGGAGGLSGIPVTALHHDRGGILWVGTLGHGLARYDSAGTLRRYRQDDGAAGALSNDDVSAIAEDRGHLWVATYRGGLNRLDLARAREGDVYFRHVSHDSERPDSLSDDHLTTLAPAADGSLWVGTFSAGLNLLRAPQAAAAGRGSARFQRLRYDPERYESLSSDKVYALHFDAGGALWVGTQRGLNRLEELGEEARFRHYFERDGLPSNVIWGIESDGKGRLWLSTNRGLSRFDPETETFKNYNVSHGLQSSEFNFGAHYRSRTGDLFFGGVGGMNVFHPDKVVANTAVPPVVATSFMKLDEPVFLSAPIGEVKDVSLSYLDDLITFEFASLDYTAPEENRYRYRLEGLNDSWIDLGTRRSMTFTDLAPGRYVLRVQGSNNDGVWNEEGTSIRIRVHPPFWQTWWFRLAGLVAGAGVLLSAHRHRIENARRQQRVLAEAEKALERERLISRLEAKNEELERFTYTVSHDLKAPLLTIKGFLGYLRKDVAAGEGASLERDIDLIENAANRMGVLLDDLLELSRVGRLDSPPEELPFAEIVDEALRLTAGHIHDSRVEVDVEPELPEVVGIRVRLVELLQNLIQNAVKYMGSQPSPRLEIGAGHNGSDPVFFVRDNGMGIDPRYHEKIFELFQRLDVESEGTGIGLALAKRIVEVHGGRIWVESQGSGRGSTFCFTLGDDPELSAHADADPADRS